MYVLLSQQRKDPRAPSTILSKPSLLEVLAVLTPGRWAIDLETRGTDISDPDSCVVGIGFANHAGCFYIDVQDIDPAVLAYIKMVLRNSELIAFNVNFDGGFLFKLTGVWLNWIGCAYGLFKQLSGEGFEGQSWKLNIAIRDVLGWEVSNKDEVEEALTERGWDKSDLWRLPVEILGKYGALDADAAWQLWEYLTDLCEERGFQHLLAYHKREFLSELELLVEQQLRGISVDTEGLLEYRDYLCNRINDTMQQFLNHPQVEPHVRIYNENIRAGWLATQPPQVNEKGEPNYRWKLWVKREEKLKFFNTNSKQQLAWLFYERIFSVKRETRKLTFVEVEGKTYEVEKTPGGRRSVKKQILPVFGEPGKLLMTYNKLIKEEGYVSAAINKCNANGVLHPQYNSCGTVTGRLSGGTSEE